MWKFAIQHTFRNRLDLDKRNMCSISVDCIEEKVLNASFYCFIFYCSCLLPLTHLRSLVFWWKERFFASHISQQSCVRTLLTESGCWFSCEWLMGSLSEACDISLIVFTVSSVVCGPNRSQFRTDAYLGLCSTPYDTGR